MSERHMGTPARVSHPSRTQEHGFIPSTPTSEHLARSSNSLPFPPYSPFQADSGPPLSESSSPFSQSVPYPRHPPPQIPSYATPLRCRSMTDLGGTPIDRDRRRRTRMTNSEKLETILEAITKLGWTIGDFLYHLFQVKTAEGVKVDRSPAHRSKVAAFLSGQSTHKPADILAAWLDDPASKPSHASYEFRLAFSTSRDFRKIKHAYPAITSSAVQLVRERLLKEMQRAVHSSGGLQGSLPSVRGKQLSWEDVGPATVNEVKEIIEELQPLTWHLVTTLASPALKTKGGSPVVRKSRPPELAATEIISSLNFCHTRFARRLPVARAILYVACGAQQTLFRYGSRVAHIPSWNTTYKLLRKLAAQSAQQLVELGRSQDRAAGIRIDNVQKFLKQREMRMGRASEMKVGLAATAAEMIGFNPIAFDIADKQARIAQDKRKDLTVTSLLEMIDAEHQNVVCGLQWLQTLVNYIPQLHQYKGVVAELYRTMGAKKLLPQSHQTIIHPMQTIAKNEAVTKELRDALNDVLGQLGQNEESYIPRLTFIGGDGMTYEKILQLKRYLQFQSNEFRRLDLLWPFLENWHTGWTRLSLIYETHWGDELTRDPSRIAHSASKIGQKGPTNLKKVDYYPSLYLAYLVLDARMLDCWRIHLQAADIFQYFEDLERRDQLPTLDELHKTAEVLHNRYSTRQGYHFARHGFDVSDERTIPRGTPWDPPPSEGTSADQSASSANQKGKKKVDPGQEEGLYKGGPYKGDQCLAQSIMFMHDTLMLREVTRSVAEGDVGRLYEGTKAMMFNFAGSTHSKYATYLLEMIADLELESSPAFREAFFMNWLVNPSGEPGRYQEGDLMQEHYNRELESFIAHKDGEWDDIHLREVIAPNIHRFLDAKKHWGEGLGLAKRRGKHTSPESKPEIRTLLRLYQDEELHVFREGRSYDRSAEDVDTFGRGVDRLASGKLNKWIEQTMRARNLARSVQARQKSPSTVESDAHHGDAVNEVELDYEVDAFDDLDHGNDDEEEDGPQTRGSVQLVNGELVVEVDDGKDGDVNDADELPLPASSSDSSSDEGADEEDINQSDEDE